MWENDTAINADRNWTGVKKMATEKRLIDADALKRAIRAESWVKNLMVQLTLDYIDIIIDEAPTVDAVEVVRCKDCKHYEKTTLGNRDRRMCTKVLGLTIPNPDDFCSYGERKDNERKAD